QRCLWFCRLADGLFLAARNAQANARHERLDAVIADVQPGENIWQQAQWRTFCEMLPEYAAKGHGEGFMHDTAMLLGALGWSEYDQPAEVVTPYFGSSGTGQINAILPVSPVSGSEIPKPKASLAREMIYGDSRI
ncbi:hypothetical protein G8764_21990, partial [Pseudomaricurvus alcaniphilus]|nr:hypothetical protein [Pseudomaricurvus alcaniphilus]